VLATITGIAAVAVLPAPTMCITLDEESDRVRLLAMARRVYQALPADQGDRFAIIDELHRLGMRELDG
jgi:hypothetical protein